MRTDRPYRQALSHDAARAEIVRSSGSQLDPRVVTALLTVVDNDRPTDALESISSRSPGTEALDIRPVPAKQP
jgi:HD-GYP domain-containing protein (c-di-GMP phosphodiesterase class II)